jgi:hypothetical protein
MSNWSNKPYRGKSSFNLPEMFGMSNKSVLLLSAIVVVGIVGWKYSQNNISSGPYISRRRE